MSHEDLVDLIYRDDAFYKDLSVSHCILRRVSSPPGFFGGSNGQTIEPPDCFRLWAAHNTRAANEQDKHGSMSLISPSFGGDVRRVCTCLNARTLRPWGDCRFYKCMLQLTFSRCLNLVLCLASHSTAL